jgi:serine/threonine-protein kinase
LQAAAGSLWELASRAAQLEGELASQSRRLDSTERRGRALRAELGRKVEELATDESRALREASDWRGRAKTVDTDIETAVGSLERARAHAREVEHKNATQLPVLREAFEAVGAARATLEAGQRQAERYLAMAKRHEGRAAELRKQIEDLRSQLQRYSDALENDLSSGRERIAAKVKEALGYEERFGAASALLVKNLRDRPECQDMIEDIVEQDRRSRGLHERRGRPRVSDHVTDAPLDEQREVG